VQRRLGALPRQIRVAVPVVGVVLRVLVLQG
jgi:hypothetical protein